VWVSKSRLKIGRGNIRFKLNPGDKIIRDFEECGNVIVGMDGAN
jgi:hypothetical protein